MEVAQPAAGRPEAGALRSLTAAEFARRIAEAVKEQDKRYAFFVGAGCSVSSGIPAADSLVRDHWLPRLKTLCGPDVEGDEWILGVIDDYDPAVPAQSYGPVMERLFLHPEERQREIERLCEGRFPGFGYAVLAAMMALPGGHFNVALTTNFDELIADAMYLYTPARPLVIHHESLASFIRPTRSRPLLVKLHGDYRLTPYNTAAETERLKSEMETHVPALLHDRGLIFLGYGGNDIGIKMLFNRLPAEALPLGVYWVSGAEPTGVIREWLEARHAVWVEHADFDELMLLLRDLFGLEHPSARRFDDVFTRYRHTYEELSQLIVERSAEEGPSPLSEAVRRADEEAEEWWRYVLEASRMRSHDVDAAEAALKRGLAKMPDSAELLHHYGRFLAEERPNDTEAALEMFRRAAAIAPRSAYIVGTYAMQLALDGDAEEAARLFPRVIELDPAHAINLANYAEFEYQQGRPERARSLGDRALDAANAADGLLLALALALTRFACGPSDERSDALAEIKKRLERGDRASGWRFAESISAAPSDHPDRDWLPLLAQVVADKASIVALESWERWRSAQS